MPPWQGAPQGWLITSCADNWRHSREGQKNGTGWVTEQLIVSWAYSSRQTGEVKKRVIIGICHKEGQEGYVRGDTQEGKVGGLRDRNTF